MVAETGNRVGALRLISKTYYPVGFHSYDGVVRKHRFCIDGLSSDRKGWRTRAHCKEQAANFLALRDSPRKSAKIVKWIVLWIEEVE